MGWGCSSTVEHLPSLGLGLVPTITKKKKKANLTEEIAFLSLFAFILVLVQILYTYWSIVFPFLRIARHCWFSNQKC
jgi:hypothetical protein